MRKIYAYLFLTAAFLSCDNKEELSSKSQTNNNKQLYIINDDIEYYADITDGSKPKKPIFIYDIPVHQTEISKDITAKTSEQSTILDFNYGMYNYTNSGCTIKRYNGDKEYYTDAGVYGANPYPQNNGYLIRGYGKPHHNIQYNSLILKTSNENFQYVNPRYNTILNRNLATTSEMSIEYQFKPNITYEISLLTHFVDNRKLTEKKNSEGFPSLIVELRDSPILSTIEQACENDLQNWLYLANYHRSYTLENSIIKDRIITFKFSPTEQKNALIISLIPKLTEDRSKEAPKSSYTMLLPTITIKELPFDPSLNISEDRGGRR